MKNDYYVYLHKTLDGKVFYVGKGRLKRAWSKAGRNLLWKEVSANGYSVELYKENLSEKEALELETYLIRSTQNLVNKIVLTPIKFDDYAEYFSYDSTSPSGLSRIKGVFNGTYENGKLGHCGYKLTRACGSQHWVISFKNRNASVHRIIWELNYGEIPEGMVIDHLDGNSLNNNLNNLRLVTKSKNRRNTKKYKNTVGGTFGVHLINNKQGNPSSWLACVSNLNGERIRKYFSIGKLGYDEAFSLACRWRSDQISFLNDQGAGYTERHGK